MQRETIKDLIAAKKKHPKDRTPEEAALVKRHEPEIAQMSEGMEELVQRSRELIGATDTKLLRRLNSAMNIERLRQQDTVPAIEALRQTVAGMESETIRNMASEAQKLAAEPPRSFPTIRPVTDFRDLQEHSTREKGEQRAREIETVESLRRIVDVLQDERKHREQLEEKIREQDEELTRLRSGAPGRPTAMHLVEEEFERRVESGDIEPTITEQSEVLSRWLRSAHPHAHPLKPKSIRNKLGPAYRRTRHNHKSR